MTFTKTRTHFVFVTSKSQVMPWGSVKLVLSMPCHPSCAKPGVAPWGARPPLGRYHQSLPGWAALVLDWRTMTRWKHSLVSREASRSGVQLGITHSCNWVSVGQCCFYKTPCSYLNHATVVGVKVGSNQKALATAVGGAPHALGPDSVVAPRVHTPRVELILGVGVVVGVAADRRAALVPSRPDRGAVVGNERDATHVFAVRTVLHLYVPRELFRDHQRPSIEAPDRSDRP